MPSSPSFRAALLAAACLATTATAARAADTGTPDGDALYQAQCSGCHQADASGQDGQFPPLKGRVDKIAASPEGKIYLANVLTHGLSGPIDIAGDSYAGVMPSFAKLPDNQIAAILSYVSSLGDSKPAPVFTAADIAAAHARNLTPAAVHAERASLDAQHALP